MFEIDLHNAAVAKAGQRIDHRKRFELFIGLLQLLRPLGDGMFYDVARCFSNLEMSLGQIRLGSPFRPFRSTGRADLGR
jgi:hypothetical protein